VPGERRARGAARQAGRAMSALIKPPSRLKGQWSLGGRRGRALRGVDL